MRYFRRFFFLFVVGTIIQTPSFSQTTSAYLIALKYIVNKNAGKSIIVSDTIIHLPFHDFAAQICKLWNRDCNGVHDVLDSLDQAEENRKTVLNEFKNLKFNGREPTQIVYFSNFYSLMVIGEVIEQNKKHGLSHEVQTGFNQSTQYLFVFDKRYSLKKVFKIKLAYD